MKKWLIGILFSVSMLMCLPAFADVTAVGLEASPVFTDITYTQPARETVISAEQRVYHSDTVSMDATTVYFRLPTAIIKPTVIACGWSFEPVQKPMKVPIAI